MAETLSVAIWCAEPTSRFDLRKFQFLRRDALLDVLGRLEGINVLDWGKTSDKYEHEIVDLVIELTDIHIASVTVPALAYLRRELEQSGASTAAIAAATTLIGELEPKQAAEQIAAVHLHLLNNFVTILYPAGKMAQTPVLRMIAPDGNTIDLPYDATEAEIAQLTGKHA